MSKPARIAVLFLAAGTLTCTIDDPQVTRIGAVTIFPVNPAIVSQAVTVAPPASVSGNRMQSAIWTLTEAVLDPDGEAYDLLFIPDGDPPDCRAIDTPTRATLAFGDCLDFIVLEAIEESAGAQIELQLRFWVRFKRVSPFVIPLIGDEDGDGLLNGNDNCPIVSNVDQTDSGGFGIGDACRVVDFFSGVQLDSDGDGVSDRNDNCVHIANPLQIDSPSGDFADIESAVSDGIGLACAATEQVIDIGRPMNPMDPMDPQLISRRIPIDFILDNSQAFLVVDFNDAIVAPDCEWGVSTCTNFDPLAIRACIHSSAFDAVQGCN